MRCHRASFGAVGVGTLALVLTACAQGTATDEGSGATSSFDREAALTGSMQIMGFGAGDEIATTRYEAAQEALPDVDFTLVEGDLDIQQFLSAVASGEPPRLVYANRDQIGTFASRGRSSRSTPASKGRGSTPRSFARQPLTR